MAKNFMTDKDVVDEALDAAKGKGKRRSSNSKKQNGRKPRRGGKPKQDYNDGPATETEEANSPDDWDYNPHLTQAAASLPTAYPLGITYRLGEHDKFSVPGIMAIDVVPGPGSSEDTASAVTSAFRELFADARMANSGFSNYQSADMGLYFLQYDDATAFYYNAARAYAALGQSDPFNRYKPQAFIQALGFDYDDLVANYAQFNYAINRMATLLNSFCVPALPYFQRHSSMFSNIYTDVNILKAQDIIFRPAGFRTIVKDDPDTPGYLKWHDLEYTSDDPEYHGITVSLFTQYADTIIQAMASHEDIAIMIGDILKRWGLNVFRVTPIPQFIMNEPLHSEDILLQIKNMRILPIDQALSYNFDVTQHVEINNSYIEYAPKFEFATSIANAIKYMAFRVTDTALLDFTKDNPEPKEFVEYTRFMPTIREGIEDNEIIVDNCGTEIVVRTTTYTYVDGVLNVEPIMPYVMFDSSSDQSTVLGIARDLARIESFDYAPFVYAFKADTPGYPTGDLIRIGELDNFAFVTGNNLKNMHEAALFSLWRVPMKLVGQK